MKKKIGLLLLVITMSIFVKNKTSAANFISYVLIEEAVKEGKISSEQGILYKVYRRFAIDKLPREFRSEISEPCGTRLWFELKKNWSGLSAETKDEIRKYVKVQEYPDGVVVFTTSIPPLDRSYSYGNFLIRYTTTGIHRVNPADADLDGIPDYIETIAFCFQNYSWTIIAKLGYFMPSTPYTVNVFALRRSYGINGEMQSIDLGKTIPDKTASAAKSYINIDNGLDLVRTYTDAHELFHAIQTCNCLDYDYASSQQKEDRVDANWHPGRRWKEASFTGMFEMVPVELKVFLFGIIIFVLIKYKRGKVYGQNSN